MNPSKVNVLGMWIVLTIAVAVLLLNVGPARAQITAVDLVGSLALSSPVSSSHLANRPV